MKSRLRLPRGGRETGWSASSRPEPSASRGLRRMDSPVKSVVSRGVGRRLAKTTGDRSGSHPRGKDLRGKTSPKIETSR